MNADSASIQTEDIEDRVSKNIDDWRSDLLDLTQRNPLLNLTGSRASRLALISPAGLEETLLALESQSSDDLIEIRWMTGQNGQAMLPDLQTQKKSGDNGSRTLSDGNLARVPFLLSDEPEDRAVKILERLRRRSISFLSETGSHCLHLVVCGLEYSARPGNDSLSLAPLLTWPVQIVRQSSGKGRVWSLSLAGEPQDNEALHELLNKNNGLVLPRWNSSDGESNPAEWPQELATALRTAGSGCEGWRVVPCLGIQVLSFSGIDLYHDLAHEGVKTHPHVRSLARGMTGAIRRMEEADLDRIFYDGLRTQEAKSKPESVMYPLTGLVFDADSSQHSALLAVQQGKERGLVIEGPPGTGKSQTIANMIAGALADGKSVLFVSQKLAALEVVAGKMEEAGLGDFCLRMHGNDARTREFVAGLSRNLDIREEMGRKRGSRSLAEWRENCTALQSSWAKLAALPATLQSASPETGLTGWQTIWKLMQFRLDPKLAPVVRELAGQRLPQGEKSETDILELLDQLGDAFRELKRFQAEANKAATTDPLRGITVSAGGHEDREALDSALKDVHGGAKTLHNLLSHPDSTLESVLNEILKPGTVITPATVGTSMSMLKLLPEVPADMDWSITRWLDSKNKNGADISKLLGLVRSWRRLDTSLGEKFPQWEERDPAVFAQAAEAVDKWVSKPDAVQLASQLPASRYGGETIEEFSELLQGISSKFQVNITTIENVHEFLKEYTPLPSEEIISLVNKAARFPQSEEFIQKVISLKDMTSLQILSGFTFSFLLKTPENEAKTKFREFVTLLKDAYQAAGKQLTAPISQLFGNKYADYVSKRMIRQGVQPSLIEFASALARIIHPGVTGVA